MKISRNTVLKHSQYTTALTRNLKAANRLHCRVDEENNVVYVCNGYFLVKLTPAEYDALVRPITQREAGNFVMNSNGETDATQEPMDMAKLLADANAEAVHDMIPAPFLVDPITKGSKAKIATYYSESGDFVAGFNAEYDAIITGDAHKGKGPISPMVIYSGGEPLALILPVQLTSQDKPSRIPAAVRAYFNAENRPESKSVTRMIHDLEAAENAVKRAEENSAALRRKNEQLRQNYAQKHSQVEELERQIRELQAAMAAKNERIEALTERLNAQPDPKEAQLDQTPADKAAALVEKLTALEDITATIRGAQTAAPVVWLTGKADAHKDKIEAMGGKWSVKRGAWYFKVA